METTFEGIRLLHENGLLYFFAFAMGASVGSFLNVVIYRWPLDLSLVTPGSHCPSCKRKIPWYLNIPIVSWMFLLGRCRWCGARISIQYLLVEIAGGAWAVLSLWKFGPTIPAAVVFVVGAALLAGSVIDIHYRLLPDVITIGLIPVGITMAALPEAWMPGWPVDLPESITGALVGGGLFWLVLLIFKYSTGREGMGFGDVKLMFGLGAFLGLSALPAVIFFASFTGIATWGILAFLRAADREYPVPFGPFLSAAALMVLILRYWLVKYWIIIPWISIIGG